MLRIHWWEAWTVTSIRSASVHIWWKCQRSSGLTTKSQTTQQSRGLKRHWKKWPMTPPETAFRLKASKIGWDGLEEIGFMFGFRCKPSRLRLVNYCWSVKRHRKQLVLKMFLNSWLVSWRSCFFRIWNVTIHFVLWNLSVLRLEGTTFSYRQVYSNSAKETSFSPTRQLFSHM